MVLQSFAALVTTLLAAMQPPLAPQRDDPVFPATKPQPPIRLFEGDAPGARGTADTDIPTLTPYLAPASLATGAAVVVLPGGGYGALAKHEGEGYARWLNGLGLHAFVCKYRLGRHGYRHPCMLQDAARSVRLVRHLAARYDIDPGRIGIIGSSAGGHLASTLLTHWDLGDPNAADGIERRSSRPDFGILCYPVIAMQGEFAHGGSRRNLLGKEPGEQLLRELSTHLQVTPETPPTLLWHTAADGGVSVRNSYAFADALARAGVPHELHVYPLGRHGLGLGVRDPSGRTASELLPWTRACSSWLGASFGDNPLAVTLDDDAIERMRALARAQDEVSRALAEADLSATVVARIGDVVALRVDLPDAKALVGVPLVADQGKQKARMRCIEVVSGPKGGTLLLARIHGESGLERLRAGWSGAVRSGDG